MQSCLPTETTIFFPELPCFEHILIDGRGRQHVVLRGNGLALQLLIEGVDVGSGPVALTFLVRGFDALRTASDHLWTLRRILSQASSARLPRRWTPTTRKLRDTLVTLDGRLAGASYHEIAVVLYGTRFVDLNWRTGLKERIRRHYSRGLTLSAGGYRGLLQQIRA